MPTLDSSTTPNGSLVNNNNNDNDADSVLDPSEQTRRPPDLALHQQRVNAWHPILDPVWVIVALLYLGVILVPVGFKIEDIQRNVVEMEITYDAWPQDKMVAYDINQTECAIGDQFNANKTCRVSFTVTEDLSPPILIHYRLTNFHQNHRSYYKSRDAYQLLGQVGNQDSVSAMDCAPLNKLGNITLNPCGLIANTLFNDYFKLVSGNDINGQRLEMIEDGIAWASDIRYLYAQPDGFNYSECPKNGCDASCCLSEPSSCTEPYIDKKEGKCYRYYYPLDDTTQYLHETYPDIISPIEGVLSERFAVWMRIAAQPDFRKLYGWIDQPIAKGEVVEFEINNNFVVTRFQGSKSLLMGTTSIFGGQNPYLAPVFKWCGVFFLVAAGFFTIKHVFRPRKLADPAYLHFKDE